MSASKQQKRVWREDVSLFVNQCPIGNYNLWKMYDAEQRFYELCLEDSVITKHEYNFDVKDIDPELLRSFFKRLAENSSKDNLEANPGLLMSQFNDYESATLQRFCEAVEFVDLPEVVAKWRAKNKRSWDGILLDMANPQAVVTQEDEMEIVEHMSEILKNAELRKHLMNLCPARVCRISSKLKPDVEVYRFIVDYTCVNPEERACLMWTVSDWDKMSDEDLLRLRKDVPNGIKIEVELGPYLEILRIKRDVMAKMSEMQQVLHEALERSRAATKTLEQGKDEEAQHASQ